MDASGRFEAEWDIDESILAAVDDYEKNIHNGGGNESRNGRHAPQNTNTRGNDTDQDTAMPIPSANPNPWDIIADHDESFMMDALDMFEGEGEGNRSNRSHHGRNNPVSATATTATTVQVPANQQVFRFREDGSTILANPTAAVGAGGAAGAASGFSIEESQHSFPPKRPLDPCDGCDDEACKTWTYPTNFPIRDYQYNICQAALLKNTLVCLPTGLGKTFIGAVVMYNFYRWYPNGKVVFMAPTKPLVAQQIEACRNITCIPRAHAAEMTGGIAPPQRAKLWEERRVFFVTPQVLVNDLSRGTCKAKSIVCLVIDEAHRATGNHAYSTCVQQVAAESNRFRILALTATPGKDMLAVQNIVNNLLVAHVEIRDEGDLDVRDYVQSRQTDSIVVKLNDHIIRIMKQLECVLTGPVQSLVKKGVFNVRSMSDVHKGVVLSSRDKFRKDPPAYLRGHAAMSRVESDYAQAIKFTHAIGVLRIHGLAPLKAYLESLKRPLPGKRLSAAQQDVVSSTAFRQLMADLTRLLEVDKVPSHPKIEHLVNIVVSHFKGGEATRVMIFTSLRDSVGLIVSELRKHAPHVRPMAFVGQATGRSATSGLSQKEQAAVMKQFRNGNYNTLVATCIGEEGLDIGDVDLIVCYDATASPIRLVQRMGRTGRKRGGRVVFLVTEGFEEGSHKRTVKKNSGFGDNLRKSINAGRIVLFDNNHRMLPDGIRPQPVEILMEPDPNSPPFEPPTRQRSRKKKADQSSAWTRNTIIIDDTNDREPRHSLLHDRRIMGKWLGYQYAALPTHLVSHSSRTMAMISVLQKCRQLTELAGEDDYVVGGEGEHQVELEAPVFALPASQGSLVGEGLGERARDETEEEKKKRVLEFETQGQILLPDTHPNPNTSTHIGGGVDADVALDLGIPDLPVNRTLDFDVAVGSNIDNDNDNLFSLPPLPDFHMNMNMHMAAPDNDDDDFGDDGALVDDSLSLAISDTKSEFEDRVDADELEGGDREGDGGGGGDEGEDELRLFSSPVLVAETNIDDEGDVEKEKEQEEEFQFMDELPAADTGAEAGVERKSGSGSRSGSDQNRNQVQVQHQHTHYDMHNDSRVAPLLIEDMVIPLSPAPPLSSESDFMSFAPAPAPTSTSKRKHKHKRKREREREREKVKEKVKRKRGGKHKGENDIEEREEKKRKRGKEDVEKEKEAEKEKEPVPIYIEESPSVTVSVTEASAVKEVKEKEKEKKRRRVVDSDIDEDEEEEDDDDDDGDAPLGPRIKSQALDMSVSVSVSEQISSPTQIQMKDMIMKRLMEKQKARSVEKSGKNKKKSQKKKKMRKEVNPSAAAFILDEAAQSGEGHSSEEYGSDMDMLDSSFINDESQSMDQPTNLQALYMTSLLSPHGPRRGGNAFRLKGMDYLNALTFTRTNDSFTGETDEEEEEEGEEKGNDSKANPLMGSQFASTSNAKSSANVAALVYNVDTVAEQGEGESMGEDSQAHEKQVDLTLSSGDEDQDDIPLDVLLPNRASTANDGEGEGGEGNDSDVALDTLLHSIEKSRPQPRHQPKPTKEDKGKGKGKMKMKIGANTNTAGGTTPTPTQRPVLNAVHPPLPPPLQFKEAQSKKQVILDTFQLRTTLASMLRTNHGCRVIAHKIDCADLAFGHVGILRRPLSDFFKSSTHISGIKRGISVLCSTYNKAVLIVENYSAAVVNGGKAGLVKATHNLVHLVSSNQHDSRVQGQASSSPSSSATPDAEAGNRSRLMVLHSNSLQHTAELIARLAEKESGVFGDIPETKSKQAEFLESVPTISTVAALALSHEPLSVTLNRSADDFIRCGLLSRRDAQATVSFFTRQHIAHYHSQ